MRTDNNNTMRSEVVVVQKMKRKKKERKQIRLFHSKSTHNNRNIIKAISLCATTCAL